MPGSEERKTFAAAHELRATATSRGVCANSRVQTLGEALSSDTTDI